VAAFLLWFVGGASANSLGLDFFAVNATSAAFLALAGIAQMIVMASGGASFDLSLPYIITLSAYILSWASGGMLGGSQLRGVVVALGVGAGAGLINALLIWVLKIPPMVATLATGYILYSLIVGIQRNSTSVASGGFQKLLRAQVFGFTGALGVCLATLIVVGLVLSRGRYGRHLRAMGQNREAARLAGVHLGSMVTINYVVSGVLAAWLGIIISSFQGAPSANLGTTYLMGSVAAVVVGGTTIAGGRTSVIGTALGALVLTFVVTDLIVWQMDPGYQNVIQGCIVIATVSLGGVIKLLRRSGAGRTRLTQRKVDKT
jgi:ribose transport system permease protein